MFRRIYHLLREKFLEFHYFLSCIYKDEQKLKIVLKFYLPKEEYFFL